MSFGWQERIQLFLDTDELQQEQRGRQSTGRQTNWATHFGQLGDNAPNFKKPRKPPNSPKWVS